MSRFDSSLPPDDARMKAILSNMKRIAVVGISAREDRASHGIAKFLINQGFEVIGVNPVLKEDVLGMKIYPTLADIPESVDVVNVFRRSDAVPEIAAAAIARKDKCLWLQEGVVHDEAAAAASSAGLDVIMDRCLYKDWLRLMNG